VKIHLIGIGGTGMGALAGLLKEAGHDVRGSDGPLYPPMSTLLSRLGVPVFEGYKAGNLDWQPDRVVVGNICRVDHPEAAAARERGLELTSFPALLSELFLASRHVVVVAGTHGKTTTASMMAHVLRTAGKDPGYLIGGIPRDLGRSFSLGSSTYFVVEGDEYDCAYFDKRPKFVHYRPSTVILTGIEFDHADIYPTMAEVEQAFTMLLDATPDRGRLVLWADSPTALRLARRRASCSVETYSLVDRTADWTATATLAAGGRQQMTVQRDGRELASFELRLTGAHNAANALGVAAAALGLGVSREAVSEGLRTFTGVQRRQEVRGVEDGVTVIDDFAHHPTAVRETVAGLRGAYAGLGGDADGLPRGAQAVAVGAQEKSAHGGGRLIAVFEPRSATSRRRVFQDAYVEALRQADHAVIAGLHAPEGIPAEERLDPAQVARDLRTAGTEANYLETVEAIVEHLVAVTRPGDTVVVMSSGGFGGLIDRLLSVLRLRERQP
jgi:UDP-N-acetylmuramate: L-alanyl-gamma-D-glutamyl-meso-diaminopimelate ligase